MCCGLVVNLAGRGSYPTCDFGLQHTLSSTHSLVTGTSSLHSQDCHRFIGLQRGFEFIPVCLPQHMTVQNELSSKLNDQANKHIWERVVQLMLKVKDFLYCTVIVHWEIFFQALNNVLYYHCITHFQETWGLQYEGRSILVKIHLASPSPPLKKLSKNKPETLNDVSYALNPGILKHRLDRFVDCWDTFSLWLKKCWGYRLKLLQAAQKEHFKALYLPEFTLLCSSTLFWKQCFYSPL